MSEESAVAVGYELRERLAEEAAEAAEKATYTRRTLREDPDFTDARWWLARHRGERDAIGKALGRLQRKLQRERLDLLRFAGWAWREHKRTNEWQSDTSGRSKRAAKGHHHGYYLVLQAVKEVSDIEFEDYADEEEVRAVA